MWDPEVRRSLLKADRVVPSLDAVTAAVFRNINKPHPSLEPGQIIEGIRTFREEYKGQLHVEIALVSGVNNNAGELSALARAIEPLRPDKIELNTVVRPPARAGTQGLTDARDGSGSFFFQFAQGPEIVGVFSSETQDCSASEIGTRIVETVEKRDLHNS